MEMNVNARSTCFAVVESTQVGEARRAASHISEQLGLDSSTAGRISILVTEMANNLQKHAREGTILLRRLPTHGPGVEILAIDRGPGMADIDKCFRDGYSTIGTPGTGLGSIARLADLWDIYSQAGIGTVLMAQVREKKARQNPSRLDLGAVILPVKTEVHCGDNWAHDWNPARERIMVADGLGHGEFAAEAADEAAVIFRQKPGHSLMDVMQSIHNALKKTRGAAVALAELDFEQRLIRYVGVGNIAAAILQPGTSRSLVSQNGTVGHEIRKIQEFQYPWPEGAVLVLNSDGLLSRWEVSKYPGLLGRHPSLLAGVLWRDYQRERDDIAIVVAREKSSP